MRDDDLFGLFSGLLSAWDRPFKEKDGYNVIQTEKGYIIVFNTLGISPEDIIVETNDLEDTEYEGGKDSIILHVFGNTKLPETGQVYKCDYKLNFHIPKEEIEKTFYRSKDGLTSFYIKTKIKERRSNVDRLEDGEDIPW